GAGMIKQVLTFARGIGAERTTIQPGEILATVAEFARETFPKLIRIDAAPDDGVWSIRGNRDQLEQLLMNLCINARDGMPAGGTIKMGAENIVFDENYCLMNQDARPGPYVVLTVADTVTVIPKDKMEKVFDPLTRTIDHGAVAGLGLSTSFSIVRSHDGFIRASSEPEKGSEFKVYIPAMEATVIVRDNEQRKDLPTGNGETILVVDDEAAIREITKATLETFGYRVITASDGAEAVAVYADRPDSISLIFTDIMMTCMNGDSAIRSIRELNPGVKIVTTSGLTSVEQIRESVGTNDISFLPKPYTAEQLIKTVHSALSAG
ncbi:MAG TPA: response regulator, partial [Bacteroidota bacterium]